METSHYENNIISTILIGADTLCTMDKNDDSLAGINEFIGEATDRLRRIADELKETQADKSLQGHWNALLNQATTILC